MSILLRDVISSDLPFFFEYQSDPESAQMAAFPSRDKETFLRHWEKILADNSIILKTILFDGQVAGHLVTWRHSDEQEVGYWLGKEVWGKGLATQALTEFLRMVSIRPLTAHVAKNNLGSQRVLEKCGFQVVGEDRLLDKEGNEIAEGFILRLDAKPL